MLLAAFAVTSGLAQTLAIESLALRYGAFAVAVLATFGAALIFRSPRQYEIAVKALQQLTGSNTRLTTAPVLTEAELREVWRLDMATFADHSVPLAIGLSWWRRYPRGIHALKQDGEILGYISLWPLTARAYHGLLSGAKLETEITAGSILGHKAARSATHWYVGSIAVVSRIRRSDALAGFITQAVRDWLSNLDDNSKLHVCALAYSSSGERLLHRFGFSKYAEARETPHHLPVYARESSVAGIRSTIDTLDNLHRKSEPVSAA